MHNTTCELGLRPPPPCSKSLFRVDYEGPLYTYIYIYTHTHTLNIIQLLLSGASTQRILPMNLIDIWKVPKQREPSQG